MTSIRIMALTTKESLMLEQILDNWLESLPDATEATIEDDSIEGFEEMLKLVGDYEEQGRIIDGIRSKLDRADVWHE